MLNFIKLNPEFISVKTINYKSFEHWKREYLFFYSFKIVWSFNPKILKVGSHVGKCSETYGNITKTKKRFFPAVLHSGVTGRSKTFYTLKDSCAIHSAIERLTCTW